MKENTTGLTTNASDNVKKCSKSPAGKCRRKSFLPLLLAMILCLALSAGCGSASSSDTTSSYEMSGDGSQLSRSTVDENYNEEVIDSDGLTGDDFTAEEAANAENGSEEIGAEETKSGNSESKNNESGSDESGSDDYSEKLIYSYYFGFETTSFDKSLEFIESELQKYNGYMESSSVYGTENRSDYMVIRIPAENADAFLKDTDSIGTVVSQEVTTENITLEYYDLQAHIETLTTQRKRLLELLEKAENVSDVIEIQNQISSVEYEINSCQTQLKVYDNQVEYVTFTISLNEVASIEAAKSEGFFARVKQGFSTNTANVLNDLVEFSIWFLTMIPYFLVLAVIIVILLKLRKRFRKSKKEKPAKKERKRGFGKKKEMKEEPVGDMIAMKDEPIGETAEAKDVSIGKSAEAKDISIGEYTETKE